MVGSQGERCASDGAGITRGGEVGARHTFTLT